MGKQLLIVYGEEFKIQVREKINEQDPFYEQYKQATYVLEKILRSAKRELDDSRENITEYSNNILAFCGERGDGKSSAMMSFIHELENNKHHSLLFVDAEHVKKTNFIDSFYIDPTTLDHVHNILDIVLAQLFMRFKKKYNKETWEENKKRADGLIESFQKVYKILSIVKDSNTVLQEEFDAAGSLAKLEKLSESITLKNELSILLKKYCAYMSDEDKNKKLVLVIDDLDLSLSHVYQITEQIRKYLIIPELVVVMGVRSDQLNLAIQEYDAAQLQHLMQNDENRLCFDETRAMGIQYTSKLIPLSHRIILPKIQDWKGIEIVLVDQYGHAHIASDESSVSIAVLKLIYRKTGMVFLTDADAHSMLLPDNLRGMVNLLVYLYSLNEPNGWKDYKTKEENIRSFLNMYYGMVLSSFPSLSKGNHIVKQIQNLVLRGATASLHQEVTNILQEIDFLYYTSWTDGEKMTRRETWQDIATDTSCGMNSLNIVIQGIQRLFWEGSGYELRKQLYAICAFYTIKANLLLTHSRIFEHEKYGFSSYSDSYIWGRLFSNVLPSVNINESGKLMRRMGIPMPSARIFNCIADIVRLTTNYRMSEDGDIRVKTFGSKDISERTKFIFTWIMMSFLSNGFTSIKIPPQYIKNKDQYFNTLYIYSNRSMQFYKLISLENYLIKPAILNTMYEKLNLGVVGVSKEEFENVVDIFYKYNDKLWKVSEILTANVDMILLLPRMVFGEYKNRAESSLKRTEELVYNVFEKICNMLKSIGKNDVETQLLSADDLRYVRYGENDTECVDVAYLYAVLIEQASAMWQQQEATPKPELESKVQLLRDILDLKEIKGEPKVLDYSTGTNKTTKWKNLREKIEKMAKSVAAYIYWSKDWAYVSNNAKESFCGFYYQVLEQERWNPEGLVTEKMRLTYSSFSKIYPSKILKDKVDKIRSNSE